MDFIEFVDFIINYLLTYNPHANNFGKQIMVFGNFHPFSLMFLMREIKGIISSEKITGDAADFADTNEGNYLL